jgi:hypothetical protein
MRRVMWGVVLLALGFVAGTLVPHAQAGDGLDAVVRELHEIRGEITAIRRELERRR